MDDMDDMIILWKHLQRIDTINGNGNFVNGKETSKHGIPKYLLRFDFQIF